MCTGRTIRRSRGRADPVGGGMGRLVERHARRWDFETSERHRRQRWIDTRSPICCIDGGARHVPRGGPGTAATRERRAKDIRGYRRWCSTKPCSEQKEIRTPWRCWPSETGGLTRSSLMWCPGRAWHMSMGRRDHLDVPWGARSQVPGGGGATDEAGSHTRRGGATRAGIGRAGEGVAPGVGRALGDQAQAFPSSDGGWWNMPPICCPIAKWVQMGAHHMRG